MLVMTYTVGSVETDISSYVDWASVSIQEQINVPTQLTFNAYNKDSGFPAVVQRAYIQLFSTAFNRSLFTGFVASQPNAVFQGIRPGGVQLFQYQFICTSDEYLLNIKAVPFIPAFVDQTQGEILAGLAELLCPGYFDTSAIGSGDIEPFYQYDPTQSWCEIAKNFADDSRYRYHARDKKIWFQPYGDGPLGVKYDETLPDRTFDPSSAGLQTQVLAVPIVNDVTIIGDVEAGNSREDYFIGDGFTGNFPLRHKVFRGSSTLLVSDDWTESSYNTQQWYVNDPGDQFNIGAGALNLVSSFALPLGQAYIQYNNGLELAGGIDLEHGEFGFNDYSVGIIGGLYTEALDTNAPYSSGNCLGGFFISSPSGVETSASGAAGVVMQPTWEGQPIGTPVVSEINHTYVLQTVITAPQYVRYNRWYRSLAGTQYGGVETAVTGDVTFIIQDYDIAAATGFYYLPNITKVSVNAVNLPAFAVYGLINNQQLNLTVNYTTLAIMPMGSLSAYEGPSGLWQPTGLILPMLPPGIVAPQTPEFQVCENAPLITEPWTNPQNALLDVPLSTACAEGTAGSARTIGPMVASGAVFDIPSDATIVGVELSFDAFGVAGETLTAQLMLGGVLIGSPRSMSFDEVGSGPPLGGQTDLWGTATLTPANINELQFAITAYLESGAVVQVNTLAPVVYYTGGTPTYPGPVPPWPSDASGNIWPPPLPRSNTPTQEVLGNGFELQAAQVTQGNEVDTLAFYAQSLPAAGTPVRFLSWEARAAISRIQSSGSIAAEAAVVGDDGIRSAIVSNLSPLPRTSEDCDAAAQAFIDDRTGVFYNGTYNCTSYFLGQLTSDEQFWPTCGRYLYVNSPARGINKQWMLVTQLTITVLDAVGNPGATLTAEGQPGGPVGEVLHFSIGFGADLHLEKVLYNFVDIQPPNVLSPQDTAEAVIPRFGYQVDNAFQPDLSSIMVYPITDTEAQVTVRDNMVAPIEIRLEDANWGQGATPDYVGTVDTPNFTLKRLQFEQIWYMRFVDSTTGTYSRRSKVVRIYYPVQPLPPTLISAQSDFIQFDFNGDIRNVYGFELRIFENGVWTPIVQKPCESYGDLNIDLTKTIDTAPFAAGLPYPRTLQAYFFNHQWSYSAATEVTVPVPNILGVEAGYRFGQNLNILCTLPNRSDLIQQVWQVASDFAFSDLLVDQSTNYAGPLNVNMSSMATSSGVWVRTAISDYIGSGSWYPPEGLFIPSGNFIASDYLVGQGSVPPFHLGNLAFGSILSYTTAVGASGATLNLYAQAFNVWFPNSTVVDVPAASAAFTQSLDNDGDYLEFNTEYGFFPSLKNPNSPNPYLEFNGPYLDYSGNALSQAALTGAYQDGSVPLTNAAYTAQTCATGGPGSGGVANIDVENAGYGYVPYASYPLEIIGDGSGAAALAYAGPQEGPEGAVIVTVVMQSLGSGYTHATATISSFIADIPATFECIIGSGGGGG